MATVYGVEDTSASCEDSTVLEHRSFVESDHNNDTLHTMLSQILTSN